MPRGPGLDQRESLRMLHQFGRWNKRAGWSYGGTSRTQRMMDRLVVWGLVSVEQIRDPWGTSMINNYTPVKK
jgi:hypothetical protein